MTYQVALSVKICLPVQESQEMAVWSLGLEDPLEDEMATHSSTLAWKIPWTEEPGGLQSLGLQSGTRLSTHTVEHTLLLLFNCSVMFVSQSLLNLVHWVGDAIQPSHPLSPPSPALSVSQDQGLFRWVISSHQVAKILEFQFQHQSFQWIVRVDFL